ncbi:sugar phosphate nucleotidyltransferase [Flammeovirga kamogawensis]|uniref:NTP transferase domain-containing protein n=1 Tax=Flammeovirga kamogawensis TaxID=373891 RepID=A0ABX8GX58_9BACT|nr:sugar phosphate nucleotidyltransferase [Flammeovirga kamogawensis]MBB6460628.1 glucose-1-phosphate thymidylyltransferase [Flammeovirga kamogawensis]QWG07983.1 NTP transferase domain-containing protein [Flammeovirga kamogawensis]TRX69790.1 nucleotidyltransferase [Flammeovirga kamogawensis]
MKIIVPMAGRGSRLRPHTLTTPKPLVKIAGKPIVHRLVEDLASMSDEVLEEIAFVIGDFGDTVVKELLEIAESLGAKGTIYYQDEPLGTAHAILCAADSMDGNIIVAFADTLFKADFSIDKFEDGIIYTQKVEDPSAFGVVKLNSEGVITDFVEKPEEFVSDQAIIGIYYFKEGERLRDELQYLVDNNIMNDGEYQLTGALENLKAKGARLKPGTVEEWLDCGNKDAIVNTNQRYLTYIQEQELVHDSAQLDNVVLVSPVYVGKNVKISNAVVGPYVSVGDNTIIENSVVQNSIVQEDTDIRRVNIENSVVGNHVVYRGRAKDLSIGDFTSVKE